MPDAPRVFISYSHDDDAHKARVLALADRIWRGVTILLWPIHNAITTPVNGLSCFDSIT